MNIIIGISIFVFLATFITWLSIRWARKTMIDRIKGYVPRAQMHCDFFSEVFEKYPDQRKVLYKAIIYRSRMDIARLAMDLARWSHAGFVDMDDVLDVLSACALRFERLNELFQSSITIEDSPELKLSAKIFSDHVGMLQRIIVTLQVSQGFIELCHDVVTPDPAPISPPA